MNKALKVKRKELIKKFGRQFENAINKEILVMCSWMRKEKTDKIVGLSSQDLSTIEQRLLEWHRRQKAKNQWAQQHASS